MDKIKNTKLLGIIGAALILIGTFMPFAKWTFKQDSYFMNINLSENISLFSGRPGILILLLAIVALAILFADLLAKKVPFFEKLTNPKTVLIPVAISALLLIIFMVTVKNTEIKFMGVTAGKIKDLDGVKISYGLGTWTMWLGIIATAAFPFLYKKGE